MEYKCTQIVEQRCKEMMEVFQASLKQNSTQEAGGKQPELNPTCEEKHGVDETKEAAPKRSRKEKKLNELTATVKKEEASKEPTNSAAVEEEEACEPPHTIMQAPTKSGTSRRKQAVKNEEGSKATTTHEDKVIQVVDERKKGRNKNREEIMIHKVKVEKAEANMSASKMEQAKIEIKAGMEVTLRSPNSLAMAATATVINADPNSVGSDGKQLTEYVDVMVNYVLTEATKLPRPKGRLNKLGNAQSICIPWPRIFVNERTESELFHSKIWKNLEENLVPKDCVRQIQSQLSERKKRKRSTSDAILTDQQGNANSQATEV